MNKSTVIIKSPGRINLIGEHIDYNGGYVLPAATDLFIKFTFNISDRDYSEIKSSVINKEFNVELNNLKKSNIKWENYIIGSLISILKKRNVRLYNFNCLIEGNLPVGSGISSSSSLICGFVQGISSLNKLNFSKNDLLSISRDVEYDFIGLRGGMMDQFTIINAKKNNLILLNTIDNSYDFIESDLGNYKILLLNTNKKHNLSDSSYNDRVDECNEAKRIINESGINIKFLTEINKNQLNNLKNRMPKLIYNRARYVIEENERTKKSIKFINEFNFKSFGELMYLSHQGLKNLYEVSCKELDFLVDETVEHNQILGARMMGGGFGGCTINLIQNEFIDLFIEKISKKYLKKFSKPLSSVVTTLGKGLRQEK